MKKTLLALLVPALAVSLLRAAPPDAPVPMTQAVTSSALDADPTGWIDLLPDADLHGWKRIPYAGKTLFETNPWHRSEFGEVLMCRGLPMKGEMLLCNREFGDGTYHVEWRFGIKELSKNYNSGIFVRNTLDGTVWHQAQVGRMNVGYLFGSTLKDGKIERFKVDDQVPQRGKEVGEWNTYEVTCKGKNISLWINGAVTATWTDCEVLRGLVGLEAEGFDIEFRNVKFKEVK